MSAWPWRGLCAVCAGIYAALLLPLLITLAVSFNAGPLSRFPPDGFSLRPWATAIGPDWLEPLLLSLRMAVACALLTALLGTPLAYGLARTRFPGRSLVEAMAMGPLLLPALVTGLGITQMMALVGLGWAMGFWTLVAGHAAVALPLTLRMVAVSLGAIPPSLALAASSLGASPTRTALRVTLPLLRGGIAGGALFAFIHAFTDVNVSLFLSRPGATPITIYMLNRIDYGFTPDVAAASMMTILVPLLLVAGLERAGLLGLARRG